jgi:hypothetical protein
VTALAWAFGGALLVFRMTVANHIMIRTANVEKRMSLLLMVLLPKSFKHLPINQENQRNINNQNNGLDASRQQLPRFCTSHFDFCISKVSRAAVL